MELIDGRSLARQRRRELKQAINQLGQTPGLAVLLIGNDPASHLYVSLKEKAAADAGIHFEKRLFFAGTDEATVLEVIDELNKRPDIHGIVVQLPVPAPLSEDRLVAAIDPAKDVDGYHPENIKRMLAGESVPTPSLIAAILALITATKTNVAGGSLAIVAKSPVFTKPLQHILEQQQASVAVYRSTDEAAGKLSTADVIVTALGRPHWLTGDMVKAGAVLIDVGITELPDGQIVGDIDAASVNDKAGWLTPVPGGVGPMTVAMLLANTTEACQRQTS